MLEPAIQIVSRLGTCAGGQAVTNGSFHRWQCCTCASLLWHLIERMQQCVCVRPGITPCIGQPVMYVVITSHTTPADPLQRTACDVCQDCLTHNPCVS